jgi:hypothetical protein
MESTSRGRRSKYAAILLIPVAVALVMAVFAWPNSRQEPRDLPVGVAGPASMEQRLAAQDGAFEIHRYGSEAAARDAIEDREVYGAFVATPSGPKVLTASAASATVANMLTRAGHGAPVEDVVEAPKASSGLASSVLPLVLAGSLTALLASLITTSLLTRAGLIAAGAVLGGLAAAPIVDSWLGVVDGSWFANAGVLSLTILAIASIVAGLDAMFGHAGATIGGLTMVVLGNGWSGAATGPEMLPQPVGLIGQLLPPGAGGNLLRSTGFFDGAGAGGHVAVLLVWVAAGMSLMLVAAARQRRPAAAAAPAPA